MTGDLIKWRNRSFHPADANRSLDTGHDECGNAKCWVGGAPGTFQQRGQFRAPYLEYNILVYLPNLLAMLLVWRRHRAMAISTSIGSTLIVILFLKIHLWKAGLPIWGIWNRTFFELGVDWISWSVLAALAAAGMLVCVIGLLTEARSSYEHPAVPW